MAVEVLGPFGIEVTSDDSRVPSFEVQAV